MINRAAVYKDLVQAFCRYQYRVNFPPPADRESTKDLQVRYQVDESFKAQVDNLVHGVLRILDRHMSQGE